MNFGKFQWLAAVAILSACGADPPPISAPRCEPYEAERCSCPNSARLGTHRCNAQGTAYGACVCPPVEPPPTGCTSACGSQQCGPDQGYGCDGRSCGDCPGRGECSARFQCICHPYCPDDACGIDDGCGGVCGCPDGQTCGSSGRCQVSTPTDCCAGRTCGTDPRPACSGRTCGTACQTGFLCSDDGRRCELVYASNWTAQAIEGRITSTTSPSGRPWDTDGSGPDPRLCLTLNGQRYCTATIQNEYNVRWNGLEFPRATAAALSNQTYAEFFDEDGGNSGDAICIIGPITITEDEFRSMDLITFSCPPYGWFSIRVSVAR